MTTPTPHSADALKHDDCQAEFEAWFAKWTDDDTHFYLIKRQAAIAAWQAAWNRRPTPASDLCADLNAERINTTPASPDLVDWHKLFDRVALALNCLPSSYVDGNEHVIKAAEKRAQAAAGAVPEGWKALPPTLPNSLLRAACDGFRMALNEMTGKDAHVVRKTYAALFAAAPKAAPRRQAEAAPSEPVAWPERLPGQLEVDVPWRRMQPDWACSFLTEYARFDGAMLLRGWNAMRDALLATPPAQDAGTGDATIVAIGYESGFMATDPDHDGATVKLHYRDEATAEAAFCAITRIIDRAIANSGRTEP